jgi:hypothetical protein
MERMTADEIRERLIALDPVRAKDVSRWEIKIGEDSLGEPAVHVTVVYRDDRLYHAWPEQEKYRERLWDELVRLFPDRWPYVIASAESVDADPTVAPVR